MPYMIVERDGEYCVHKKDADGNPTESMGCSDTKEKAEAHMQALYANAEEDEDKSLKIEQLSVDDKDVLKDITGVHLGDFLGAIERPADAMREQDIHILKSVHDVLRLITGVVVPVLDSSVKAFGENRIGGYGILWGSPDRRDLVREWFAPDTKDLLSIHKAMGAIPNIIIHGADENVSEFVFGAVDVMTTDSKGLWWESEIKKHEVYREYVQPLLDRERLYSSSGTLPAAKRVDKETGKILRWPVSEMTVTSTPMEFRMLETPLAQIKSAYEAINLELPDTFGLDEGAEKARKLRVQLAVQTQLLRLSKLK